MRRLPDNHGSMTAAEIIDGLTGSEVRQFALACLQAVERATWHRDWRRFVADMRDAADLAERLAFEPRDIAPIPAEAPRIMYIPVSEALTDAQRAELRRAYIPRSRGGKSKGEGPTIKELAGKYGVSYGAAWRAVRAA